MIVMATKRLDNFHRDITGRRKSQRKSSILKSTRSTPFDDIQNISHDGHFKDRRVSFSTNVEIKEFLKGSTTFEPNAKTKAGVQISTPIAKQSRHLPADFSINRLSIIPKFEKSFLDTENEDDEYFENVKMEDEDEDFKPFCEPSPEPVGCVNNTSTSVPGSGGQKLDTIAPVASSAGISVLVSSQNAGSFTVAPSPDQESLTTNPTPHHWSQSDMELTLNDSSPPSLVVPGILCPNPTPSTGKSGSHVAPDTGEGKTVAMSFTVIADENSIDPEGVSNMDIIEAEACGDSGDVPMLLDKTMSCDMAMTLNKTRDVTSFSGDNMAMTLNKTRDSTSFGGDNMALNKTRDSTSFGGDMALNKTRDVTSFSGDNMALNKTRDATCFGGDMTLDKTRDSTSFGGDNMALKKTRDATSFGGDMTLVRDATSFSGDNMAMTLNKTASCDIAMTLNKTRDATCLGGDMIMEESCISKNITAGFDDMELVDATAVDAGTESGGKFELSTAAAKSIATESIAVSPLPTPLTSGYDHPLSNETGPSNAGALSAVSAPLVATPGISSGKPPSGHSTASKNKRSAKRSPARRPEAPPTCHSEACHSGVPPTRRSEAPPTHRSEARHTEASPTHCSEAPPTRRSEACHTEAPPTHHSEAPPTRRSEAHHTKARHTEAPPTHRSEAPPTRRCEARHTEAPPTRCSEAPPTRCSEARHTEAPPTHRSEAPPTRRSEACHSPTRRSETPELATTEHSEPKVPTPAVKNIGKDQQSLQNSSKKPQAHIPCRIPGRGAPRGAVSTPLSKRTPRRMANLSVGAPYTDQRVIRSMLSTPQHQTGHDSYTVLDSTWRGVPLYGSGLYADTVPQVDTGMDKSQVDATEILQHGRSRRQTPFKTSGGFDSGATKMPLTTVTPRTGSGSQPTTSCSVGVSFDGSASTAEVGGLAGGGVIGRGNVNWLETQDRSFSLVNSSSDSSPADISLPGGPADMPLPGSAELASCTVSKATISPVRTASPVKVVSPVKPAQSGRKRKSLSRGKKKRNHLRASLIQKLKTQNEEVRESVEVDTPEMVPVERRDVAPPSQNSIFASPDATMCLEESLYRRQSLMMSPSGFTKFLVNLNCDKTLGEQDFASCPAACVEVTTSADEEEELVAPLDGSGCGHMVGGLEGTFTKDESQVTLTEEVVCTGQVGGSDSSLTGAEEDVVCTGLAQENHMSFAEEVVCTETTVFSEEVPVSRAQPVPHTPVPAPPSLPAPVVVVAVADAIFTPPLSQIVPSRAAAAAAAHLSTLPSQRDVSSASPPPSVHQSPVPPPSPDRTPSLSPHALRGLGEEVVNSFNSDSSSFIMHLHFLRTKYLMIAHSCQTRLSSPEYMQSESHTLFKLLLESIITRANLGLSMLTLFISYGDISGLARAKGPFPTMSELPPILEDNMADKYLWMEARHNEIAHKYSDLEATMVSAAEIYHWQVDCWNRSKVEITIHNSAKIALNLEESLVCAYPQRIKRTNVGYVRGSLLFSKPQTEACTTTADIGQLLWTIIRYRGNS